jgi:hypothetical protein
MRYYQPEYNQEIWEQAGFFSFMVYKSKQIAQKDFPMLRIDTYSGTDIEDPEFVDDNDL